jgi:hypothetical protein
MTITLTKEEAQSVLDAFLSIDKATSNVMSGDSFHRFCDAVRLFRARLSAPEPDVDWKDMYEKEKRLREMLADKYEKDIRKLGRAVPTAQPEPEPVAWMNESDMGRTDWKVWAHGKPTATMPLYAVLPHPEPAQKWKYDPMTGEPLIDGWPLYSGLPKPWQGLTDEEIKSLLWETRVDNLKFARVIETLLREKNAS